MTDHTGEMFKVCPNGHRSDLSQAVCAVCNADLNNISPTYGPPDPPSSPVSKTGESKRVAPHPDSEVSFCDCSSPKVADGANICGACGGYVRPNAPESTTPASDRENERRPKVYLELPGGHRIQLGSEGVLVGRDPTVAGASIVETLRPYRGVSGRHLCLAMDQDAVVLIDLGSRNGTWTVTQKLGPYTPHRIPVSDLSCPIWLGAKAILNLIKE